MTQVSDAQLLDLYETGDARSFLNELTETLFGVSPYQVYDIEDSDSNESEFDIQVVHSEGGYEGGGEHAERVFEVTHQGKLLFYYQVNGFYASYAGTEWDDDYFFVEPRDVVVTQYFKVV